MMLNLSVTSLFHVDALAILMLTLVIFIGLCVGTFSYRYMKGDKNYYLFFFQLLALITFLIIMVCADNLAVLFIFWCLSNTLLVKLISHKKGWIAAKASGSLAAKNYSLGALFLAGAFILFYAVTGETSIQYILNQQPNSAFISVGIILLLLAAMTQSAIWPFHRWLLSSLNSPTPVSAMMHAGLVNGGGFLLVRFAPLYFTHTDLLIILFTLGMISSLIGTLWKLMQTDVKRMLACSTMAQMGFMLTECGLGLFSLAVAHLILHGMFKAYLFLASASAAQEVRVKPPRSPSSLGFIGACIAGFFGSIVFSFVSGHSWFSADTTLVVMVVTLLGGIQFSLPMLHLKTLKNLPLALMFTGLFGLAYGLSVHVLTLPIGELQLMQPQALNVFYVIGILTLILPWLGMLLIPHYKKNKRWQQHMLHAYVIALNSSQPDDKTVTTHRNHYHYQ